MLLVVAPHYDKILVSKSGKNRFFPYATQFAKIIDSRVPVK